MPTICVLQTDNRPSLDYVLKTKTINNMVCLNHGFNYSFIKLDDNKYGDLHPATKKIYIIDDFLNHTNCDILVFLDSDAWIQNGYWLNDIINNLLKNNQKQGCFSRDPYLKKHTFINSGSFIIKNNDFTKKMYKSLIHALYENTDYHNRWPYDQYYMSNYIHENIEHFIIFVPDILNTPIGKILRHNWCKNKKMHDDLNDIYFKIKHDLFSKIGFNEKKYYDKASFPNTSETGLEYFGDIRDAAFIS